MSGIQGQPSARPTNLNSPVPGQSLAEFAASQNAQAAQAVSQPTSGGGGQSLADFAAAQTQAQPTSNFGANHPWIQGAVDALPTMGAIAGGVAGTATDLVTGPAGTLGGAAAGGAIGKQLQQGINQFTGQSGGLPVTQQLLDDAKESISQTLMAGLGEGAGKVLGKIAETPAGQATINKVAETFSYPLAALESSAKESYKAVVKPVLDAFGAKGTPLNTEQSGDAIKQLFQQNIQQRFGQFVDSYGKLDAAAKVLPMGSDEVRLGFTNGLKSWAMENGLGGDNYKMVQKFANDFNDAENGAQFQDVIRQLRGKAQEAYGDQLRAQGDAYRALADKAETFFEKRTSSLAQRVSDGVASPADIAAFSKIQQAVGAPADAGVDTWAQTAKDYLNQRDQVRGAYAKFRGFLEDVGEQTRTNPQGRGPLQFLQDIQDVPSEKLVDRMFDPKNAAALRAMQSETPQVYDQVMRSKMQQILDRSTFEGQPGTVDVRKLRSNVMNLPGSTRDLLTSNAEQRMLNEYADKPVLDSLERARQRVTRGLLGYIAETFQQVGMLGSQTLRTGSRLAAKPGVGAVTGLALGNAGQALSQPPQGQP